MSNYKVDPFFALADPNRREILMLIGKQKCAINTLANNFNVSRPAISKHIKILSEAGFIQINDIGRERYCQLHPDGFGEVKEWIEFFEQFWQHKFKSLERLLKNRAQTKTRKNERH